MTPTTEITELKREIANLKGEINLKRHFHRAPEAEIRPLKNRIKAKKQDLYWMTMNPKTNDT